MCREGGEAEHSGLLELRRPRSEFKQADVAGIYVAEFQKGIYTKGVPDICIGLHVCFWVRVVKEKPHKVRQRTVNRDKMSYGELPLRK